MNDVVVGVDGSSDSARALAWALEEAEAHQVRLRIITVVTPVPTAATWPVDMLYGSVTDEDLARAQANAATMLTTVEKERGRRAQVEVGVEALIGQPAHTLCSASADARALVLGSRGAGGFGRLLLGSVSTAGVHHARCPVVIIRPPDPRSDDL